MTIETKLFGSLAWCCHHPVSAFLQRAICKRQTASTRATDWDSVLSSETARSDVCVCVQQTENAT